jgi:hypothetical protein
MDMLYANKGTLAQSKIYNILYKAICNDDIQTITYCFATQTVHYQVIREARVDAIYLCKFIIVEILNVYFKNANKCAADIHLHSIEPKQYKLESMLYIKSRHELYTNLLHTTCNTAAFKFIYYNYGFNCSDLYCYVNESCKLGHAALLRLVYTKNIMTRRDRSCLLHRHVYSSYNNVIRQLIELRIPIKFKITKITPSIILLFEYGLINHKYLSRDVTQGLIERGYAITNKYNN